MKGRLLTDADGDKYRYSCWYPIMECPKCHYQTVTTNICRNCKKMPITEEMISPVPCYHHRRKPEFHFMMKDGKRVPAMHGDVRMVYAGRVKECGKERERRYKAKEGEGGQLWSGRGVIFEDTKELPTLEKEAERNDDMR